MPPWAERERDDATYFPVPWLLSSRGYGVLVDEDATSRFDRRRAGAGAPRPTARACACGCSPARRRRGAAPLHRGGRPPARAAGAVDVRARGSRPASPTSCRWRRSARSPARSAAPGAPVSVAETQMHYLPCGAHKGREAAERERTDSFHRDGLARLVYFNPLLCASYSAVYARAAAAGVLQRGPGGDAVPLPGVRRRLRPARASPRSRSRSSTSRIPPPRTSTRGLVREAVDGGADGWMEDFGESTPPAILQHDGSTGDAAHNRYPTDYHCALQRIAGRLRPPARALPALGLDRRGALRRGGVGRRPDHGLGLRRAQLGGHAAAVDGPERRVALGHRHRRLHLVRRAASRASRARPRTRGSRPSCSRAGSSSARWCR